MVIERIYQSCKNLKFDPKTQNSTEENYVAFFIILIYPSVTLKWKVSINSYKGEANIEHFEGGLVKHRKLQ